MGGGRDSKNREENSNGKEIIVMETGNQYCTSFPKVAFFLAIHFHMATIDISGKNVSIYLQVIKYLKLFLVYEENQ